MWTVQLAGLPVGSPDASGNDGVSTGSGAELLGLVTTNAQRQRQRMADVASISLR